MKNIKPDLEKMAFAFRLPLEGIQNNWKNYENKSIPIDNSILHSLQSKLEERSLLYCYDDLVYIAFNIIKTEELHSMMKDNNPDNYQKSELLNTLKLLFETEYNNLYIKTANSIKKISSTITNKHLIQVIKDALLKEFINQEYLFDAKFIDASEIINYEKFINWLIDQRETPSKKGRKQKHHYTGYHIVKIHRYLNKYTDIKAKDVLSISRPQQAFIYDFLSLLGLFKNDDQFYKEDTIKHIFNSHIKKKGDNSSKKQDVQTLMQEFDEERNTIRTTLIKEKILNHNRKK